MTTTWCEECNKLVSILRLEISRLSTPMMPGAVREASLECGHEKMLVTDHTTARESRSWPQSRQSD